MSEYKYNSPILSENVNQKGYLWNMKENQLKQEELLQILISAYDRGEQTNDVTTIEFIEDLVTELKKVYAS